MKENYKTILGIVAGLLIGASGMYFFNNYNIEKKNQPSKKVVQNENSNSKQADSLRPLIQKDFDKFFNHSFDDDFFNPDFSPFKQMEKMRKNMDKLFSDRFGDLNSNLYFDDWFKGKFGGTVFDIDQDEDDDYVYYTIKAEGIDKSNVKVDVQDGMVNISGKVDQMNENKSEDSLSKSRFSSSFSRSFPVPSNVDANSVKFEAKDDEIVIKFPKIKS